MTDARLIGNYHFHIKFPQSGIQDTRFTSTLSVNCKWVNPMGIIAPKNFGTQQFVEYFHQQIYMQFTCTTLAGQRMLLHHIHLLIAVSNP